MAIKEDAEGGIADMPPAFYVSLHICENKIRRRGQALGGVGLIKKRAGFPLFSHEIFRYASDVEPEQNDVAVFHHIVLALRAHFALLARADEPAAFE